MRSAQQSSAKIHTEVAENCNLKIGAAVLKGCYMYGLKTLNLIYLLAYIVLHRPKC